MEKRICRLTIEHHDEILRVWSIAGLPFKPRGRDSRAMMAVEMSRDYCAFFGVFDGDRLVGLAIANYDGRRGWINRLAVDPDYRGLGLARELIEDLNYPSMGLFEKCGYRCEKQILYWTKRPRPDL